MLKDRLHYNQRGAEKGTHKKKLLIIMKKRKQLTWTSYTEMINTTFDISL